MDNGTDNMIIHNVRVPNWQWENDFDDKSSPGINFNKNKETVLKMYLIKVA